MNCNPLVSVIIPNYNHADYLDQRILSVLNQTYRNFEIIILDDCSTDNSMEIIGRYRDDDHVSYVESNEMNCGHVFQQWAKGLHLAKGELVWIAESDDYCQDTLLEELVNAFLKKKNTVIAYSTLNVVNEHGDVIEPGAVGKNRYLKGNQYVRRYMALANFIRNASCALFSKDAALSVPDDYQNYVGAGDYLFWTSLALKGNVAVVNKCLSSFRRHSGVVTGRCDTDGTNFIEEKKILDYICSRIRISGIRMIGIRCFHWDRIKSQEFDNDSIRQRIFELWNVPEKMSPVQRFIFRKERRLRLKYNYFI